MGKVEDKVITIDLSKYGGTGTWKGPITKLPSSGFSSKQYTKSVKSPGRIKNAMGGMMKKKKPMGYNIGGMAKKKKVKR